MNNSESTSTSTSTSLSPKDVKTDKPNVYEFEKQCIQEVKNMSKYRVYKTIKDIIGQFKITDLYNCTQYEIIDVFNYFDIDGGGELD